MTEQLNNNNSEPNTLPSLGQFVGVTLSFLKGIELIPKGTLYT